MEPTCSCMVSVPSVALVARFGAYSLVMCLESPRASVRATLQDELEVPREVGFAVAAAMKDFGVEGVKVEIIHRGHGCIEELALAAYISVGLLTGTPVSVERAIERLGIPSFIAAAGVGGVCLVHDSLRSPIAAALPDWVLSRRPTDAPAHAPMLPAHAMLDSMYYAKIGDWKGFTEALGGRIRCGRCGALLVLGATGTRIDRIGIRARVQGTWATT